MRRGRASTGQSRTRKKYKRKKKTEGKFPRGDSSTLLVSSDKRNESIDTNVDLPRICDGVLRFCHGSFGIPNVGHQIHGRVVV